MLPPLSDEVWIDVTSAQRAEDAHRILALGTPRPPIADLVEQARDAGSAMPVLGGGEPTLAADLPTLIAAVHEAVGSGWVLATDGLGLAHPSALRPLVQSGLPAVRVRLVSARPAAHDWFYGTEGAARAAVRAVRNAVELSIDAQIEIPLIRPTVDHLAETVEVAARIGATAVLGVHFDPARFPRDEQVTLSPRLGLVDEPLRRAADAARSAGIGFAVAGLPQCFVPEGVGVCRVRQSRPPRTAPCASTCPGRPHCPGIPDRYPELFGAAELPSDAPRAGATAHEDFRGTSRAIRMRLVRLAGTTAVLRITGLDHPDAAELLRESLRLEFARVEIVADLAPLATFSDDELHRVRRLTAITATADPPAGLLDRIRRIAPEVELPSFP